MNKAKLKKFEKAVERAQAAFRAEIDALARWAREEILPYFRKHNLDFQAGNGTWFITRPNGEREGCIGDAARFVDDDALPANIRDLLMMEVGRGDHLGFYIQDIKRGE